MSRIIGFITKFAINSKELQLASINDKSTFSRTHTWYIQQLYPADDMFCECLFMTLRSFRPLIFVDILYKFYSYLNYPSLQSVGSSVLSSKELLRICCRLLKSQKSHNLTQYLKFSIFRFLRINFKFLSFWLWYSMLPPWLRLLIW